MGINNLSLKLFLGLLSVVIVFHVCIIVKIIPYTIAWGGRLQNDSEMYVFEFVSIGVNLILGFVLLMKSHYLKFYFKEKIVNFILWFFLALFALNTIGNLFAKTTFEKFFSILTLLSAILIWRVLKGKDKTTN
jgi:membrane protease YdiL (CAAX protease family)